MAQKGKLNWKGYESITKYIYETLGKEFGVIIEGHGSKCKVVGQSGVSHQIDVLTKHTDGIHTYRTAIECKYWDQKINKDIVMKVSEIIKDTGIHKGIIVSKKGFTQDGLDFAKYSNINLVELRERDGERDRTEAINFDIGFLEVITNISILRPEILTIIFSYPENSHDKNESISIYQYTVKLANGRNVPFTDITKIFQDELHKHNKPFKIITKNYDFSDSTLINNKTNTSVSISGVTFTGMLKKIEKNSNIKITIVDQIWLMMKSIFDERTFSISENGFIKEHKDN